MVDSLDMIHQNEQPVDVQQKIQVLFKEYEALRSSILGRTNNGYQLWGIGAALLTFLMSRPADFRFWLLISLFVVIFSLFSFITVLEIEKAAKRLREVEANINGLAGDELLQWETRRGSGLKGFLGINPG
jgi:hypothetical protein